MIFLLRIKSLDLAIYDINKYILILIYISINKKDDIKILYYILKEIYLVNNLKDLLINK